MSNPQYQTQRERWMMYGGNTILVILIVLLIVEGLSVLANWKNRRVDTTQSSLTRLNPQTLKVIGDLKTPIKIVALMSEPRWSDDIPKEERFDIRQPIYDLLDEYAAKSQKITVDRIDPDKDAAKAEQLIDEVLKKYGGEMAEYEKAINAWLGKTGEQAEPGRLTRIEGLLKSEMEAFETLMTTVQDARLLDILNQIDGSFRDVMKQNKKSPEEIRAFLDKRLPEYKSAADSIEKTAMMNKDFLGNLMDWFKGNVDNPALSSQMKEYAKGFPQRARDIEIALNDTIEQITRLGELKIEELRANLQTKDSVLILGEKEMKTIDRSKIWFVPNDRRGIVDGKPKPRFNGQQQITSSILALASNSKQTVVFVHATGQPLTIPDIPMFGIQGGPYSIIASKLRELNFQVVEKDFSGQPNPRPMVEEATDEQLKNCVWIVVAPSSRTVPTLSEKLKEHLDNGGSAMVLTTLKGDDFATALDPWGIKINTNAVVVHKPIETTTESQDYIEKAKKQPHVFILNKYGEHPVVKSLNSLDGILLPVISVAMEKKPDINATAIIPIPETTEVWGETEVESTDRSPTRDDADLKGPFFGGVVAEKGKGRLVVIGSYRFAADNIIDIPDPVIWEQYHYEVNRFPANGDLFVNSVFWLTGQEMWITLSADALQINRIGPISPGVLGFWQYGVLLIGLPALVIAAGVLIFLKRRD